MVAALHDQPDVLVILLLHAMSRLDEYKFDEGLCARDRDGLTAIRIAFKNSNVASLSVLLYLYPKALEESDDFNYYPSLFNAPTSTSKCSGPMESFLERHYPAIAEKKKKNVESIRSAGNQHNYQELMICDRKSTVLTTGQLFRFLKAIGAFILAIYRTLPKSIIFMSMRTALAISLYISAVTVYSETASFLSLTRNLLCIIGQLFVWSLYSNLCIKSPGSILSDPSGTSSQVRKHHDFETGSDVVERKRTYSTALNLIYSSSNIARKCRSEQLEQVEDSDDLLSTEFCCHYCRVHRPLHGYHSRTLGRCIPQFDHYCVFLQNHVGRDNYPNYIGSLVAAVWAVMPLFFLNCCYHLQDRDRDRSRRCEGFGGADAWHHIKAVLSPSVAVEVTDAEVSHVEHADCLVQISTRYFLIWTALWWFIFFVLLCLHFTFMCRGMTTREYIQWYERKWKKRNNSAAVLSFSGCASSIYLRLFPSTGDLVMPAKNRID